MDFKTRMTKKLFALALLLALALAFSSCTSPKTLPNADSTNKGRGDIRQGTWSEDGLVFTNEWSNIKFTMPEVGYTKTSPEQMDELMLAEIEARGFDSTLKETASTLLLFDFMVAGEATSNPSITLTYENIKKNPTIPVETDATAYLDSVKAQFEQMAPQGAVYVETERTATTVAEIEWEFAKYTVNDFIVIDYYVHDEDGYIWQLIIAYTSDVQQAAEELLARVTAAD